MSRNPSKLIADISHHIIPKYSPGLEDATVCLTAADAETQSSPPSCKTQTMMTYIAVQWGTGSGDCVQASLQPGLLRASRNKL